MIVHAHSDRLLDSSHDVVDIRRRRRRRRRLLTATSADDHVDPTGTDSVIQIAQRAALDLEGGRSVCWALFVQPSAVPTTRKVVYRARKPSGKKEKKSETEQVSRLFCFVFFNSKGCAVCLVNVVL